MARLFAWRVLTCLGVCAATVSLFAADHALDLRAGGRARAAAGVSLARAVHFDEGVLRLVDLPVGATALEALAVGDRLALTLFDDVEITLTLTERVATPLGGAGFLATAEGSRGLRNAVVLQTEEGLQIDIQDVAHSRVYSVFSTAEGVMVKELNGLRPARACRQLKAPAASAASAEVATHAKVATRQAVSSGVASVDLLVVFDASATAWVKSRGGVQNFAEVAVQKMNTALANTGLNAQFRFRLVGAETIEGSVPMNEGRSMATALEAITAGWTWQGYNWGQVQALRTAAGADIVCLLTDTGSAYGVTGIGYSLEADTAAYFAPNAYNCCSIQAAAADHTMTHEVGHNMGAGHPDVLDIDPGPQYYGYSAGYYFSAGGVDYYTIMGYNSDGFGRWYTEVPYFSSPDYTYRSVAVGDARHDNSQTLALNFKQVANWYSTKVAETESGAVDSGEDVAEVAFVEFFAKARMFTGYLYAGTNNVPAGTIQVKGAKAKTNTKTGVATSRLTVTLQALGETKLSLRGDLDLMQKTIMLTAKDDRELTLAFSEENGVWTMTGDFDGDAVAGALDDGTAKAFALASGASFNLDVDALATLLGDNTYAAYFPDGLSVEQNGAKWVVANGARAGRVTLNKDGSVNEAKLGANPAALKLTFKAKTGAFAGSFKAYTQVKGKPKAITVSVSGFVVDGKGYGVATVRKLGSVPLRIE